MVNKSKRKFGKVSQSSNKLQPKGKKRRVEREEAPLEKKVLNENHKDEERDNKSDEEVDQNDESLSVETKSIIDKTKTFADLGLHPTLCGVCKDLGYKYPSKIQSQALPLGIEGKDVIGISETGSGKTASFTLPILHGLLNYEGKVPPCSAIILAPTRELAIQIREHVEAFGSQIGLKSCLIVGGMDFTQQQMEIKKKKPHIIVGTPGRVAEHLRSTPSFTLYHAKYIVLDEADKMLSTMYEDEIELIFKSTDKSKRVTFLFSATMTKKVEKLQKAHLKDPSLVQVAPSKYATVATLTQEYLFIPEKFKELYLSYLLNENPGKRIIVFCSMNSTCITICTMLRSLGFPAVPLAGHMEERNRLNCLRKFKRGERPILVATDIAARGLDIPLVELVINYDIPVISKDYVHRVGRTARIGTKGKSITIVSQYDIEYFQKIEALIGKKMTECKINKEHVMVLLNTVTKASNLARERVKQQISADTKEGKEASSSSAFATVTDGILGADTTGIDSGEEKQENEMIDQAIRILHQKQKQERSLRKKKKGSEKS